MIKIQARKKDGQIYIRCPKCQHKQELPLDKDWYEMDHQGKVSPIFVCMNENRSCMYEDHIWIVGYA
jgi:hypothetical protein